MIKMDQGLFKTHNKTIKSRSRNGIRNTEYGTESGIRNTESGIRNTESGTRNPEYIMADIFG